MDGTTEPIIVVIGHPIAGNPTQFALETGFQSAQIDCRVLSIDLSAADFPAALAGMDAMKFRAVWVTPSCRGAIQENAKSTAPPPGGSDTLQSTAASILSSLLDLLVNEHTGKTERIGKPDRAGKTDHPGTPPSSWSHRSMKRQVWKSLAASTLQRRDAHCQRLWWVDAHTDLGPDAIAGQRQALLTQLQAMKTKPFENLTLEQIEIVHDANSINSGMPLQHDEIQPDEIQRDSLDSDEQSTATEVIVFADCTDPPPGDWQLPAESITLDLNENWEPGYLAVWDRLKRSVGGDASRDCIRGIDVHAACLSFVAAALFGATVPSDVFLEALDEYLAV